MGTAQVAQSAPDGTTLVMGTPGTHATAKALYPSLPYDPIRDFAPITVVAATPNVLMVHPSLGVTDVAGLVRLAKEKPGTIDFGSTSTGGSRSSRQRSLPAWLEPNGLRTYSIAKNQKTHTFVDFSVIYILKKPLANGPWSLALHVFYHERPAKHFSLSVVAVLAIINIHYIHINSIALPRLVSAAVQTPLKEEPLNTRCCAHLVYPFVRLLRGPWPHNCHAAKTFTG